MIGIEKRPKLSVVISPTVKLRPASRLRASALGSKPRSSATRNTRERVSALSLPRPFSALDAVPTDTPARSATSVIVHRRLPPSFRGASRPRWTGSKFSTSVYPLAGGQPPRVVTRTARYPHYGLGTAYGFH